METAQILSRLKSSREETWKSKTLRQQALNLLNAEIHYSSEVPALLQEILLSIVKPLFSVQQHPSLTSTGRKALVTAPSAGRFHSSIFDDEETKLWKNGWTVDLLTFIVSQYQDLEQPLRKSTLESQFHLLVPPILNLIDDGDIEYKNKGCYLLRLLCEEIIECHSGILKRTGLTDVFSDALKTNFMLLPTLTPEEDSIELIRKLYPAFRSLVNARFLPKPLEVSAGTGTEHILTLRQTKRNQTSNKFTVKNPVISEVSTRLKNIRSAPDLTEKDARQNMLDLILRQGVLASYAHASDYVKITTLLMEECRSVVSQMGIYSAKYLYQLLPLLRTILSNPFGTAWPPLLLAAFGVMKMLVEVCWPRIKTVWWGECLRACVACFLTIEEDKKKGQVGTTKDLGDVTETVREVLVLLADVIGEDFKIAKQRLVEEDARLQALFE